MNVIYSVFVSTILAFMASTHVLSVVLSLILSYR